MRTLLRRPQSHLLQCFQHNRTLTTRPRRIPNHTSTWNPSAHDEPRAHGPPAAHTAVRRATPPRAGAAAWKPKQWSTPQEQGLEYSIWDINQRLSQTRSPSPEFLEYFRPRIWRTYRLAKAHAPDVLKSLSDRAWEVLWTTDFIQTPKDRYSRTHVEKLFRTMESTGKVPTAQQKAACLESMFYNGKEEQAIHEWDKYYLHSDPEKSIYLRPELLDTGARMHALTGNLGRARRCLNELFGVHVWDPTVIQIVFRAHTRSVWEEDIEMAWTLYTWSKKLLGDKVTLDEYDNWFVGFLEAEEVESARKVFGDMVKGRYIAYDLSPQQIDDVLRRLHLLYQVAGNLSKMTDIALHALKVLPQPYHPHLFGDWMKLAMVQHAPEATAQVMELMCKRGYEPETFHYNLLLRAFFRTTNQPHVLQAENIAWNMVNETAKSAREIVRTRSRADAISARRNAREANKSDSPLSHKVPPADAATFALLMQHHGDKSHWEHVDYLVRQLNELRLHPNEDIMNVIMLRHCAQGKYDKVWETYCSMTDVPEGEPGVFPNGASFRCLWKTLRLALGDPETKENTSLPTPRQLLAETIHWWGLVRSRPDAERFRVGLAAKSQGAINSLVLHCFSYTKDLVGSLVAMHALRWNFDIFPSNNATNILQKHIAFVEMHREESSVQAQYFESGAHGRKIRQLDKIREILVQARMDRKKITAEQLEAMGKEEAGDFYLDSLSEFVRVILKRQYSPEDVEAMIDEARKDIGLPKLKTGDMDAFAVA